MTTTLTLYTPGTPFPDLEAKIAFGLARLAVEVCTDLQMAWDGARYQITVRGNGDLHGRLRLALQAVCRRLLGSEMAYLLPGIQSKYRHLYRPDSDAFPYKDGAAIDVYLAPPTGGGSAGHTVCGHRKLGNQPLPNYGGSAKGGLLLVHSPHAGKPYARNRVDRRLQQPLCAACGLVAILGTHSACVRADLVSREGSRRPPVAVVTPVPRKAVGLAQVRQWLAAQPYANGGRVPGEVPATCLPLVLLTTYPHLAELVQDTAADLHVAAFGADSRGNYTRLLSQHLTAAQRLARFVVADPRCAATVARLVRPRSGQRLDTAPLQLLNTFLHTDGPEAAASAAVRFAREYLVSQEGYGLDPAVARYLIEEVEAMEKPTVSAVFADPAVQAVGRALRYFTFTEQNYGFVDAIRNARGAAELQEILQRLARQCHSVYHAWRSLDPARQAEQKRTVREKHKRLWFSPHLIDGAAVQRILQLAEDDDTRALVQAAIALHALCADGRRPESGDEELTEAEAAAALPSDEGNEEEDAE